ncbi:MAG: hypothetical protein ABEI96_08850 [Haloarculaceae archaeon]
MSAREVVQLSERCLSAAGIPDGTAQASAEAFWWTQAYRGSGLTTLHGLLDDLSEYDRERITLSETGSTVSVVDSGGQPGLLSSIPLLDLCRAQADRHGLGIAYTTLPDGDDTLCTLGHVAYKAARRGFVALVSYTDPGRRSTAVLGAPDQPQPLLAERELDAPSETHVALLEAIDEGIHRRRHGPLIQAVFRRSTETSYRTAMRRLLDRLLGGALDPPRRPSRDAEPGLLTVCIDPRHPTFESAGTETVHRLVDDDDHSLTRVYRPERMQDRIRTLLHDGVDVDETVWRDVFERSSRVLAPEFEGSHRGAGMDINE